MPNGGDVMPEDEAAAGAASARQYDWRPRPDPTVLTTQQLRETESAILRTVQEKVDGLRELLETRLDGMDKATAINSAEVSHLHGEITDTAAALRAGRSQDIQNLRELLTERIDGIDKATRLLAANQDRAPSEVDRSVGALRELISAQMTGMDSANKEKFAAIQTTFDSNDKALTAALAAQKEAAAEQNKSNTLAISKSEQATKETIGSNAATTQAGLTSQSAIISDLKDRVVRLEAGGVGRSEQLTESRADRAGLNQNVIIAIALVSLLVAVVSVIVVLVKK